MNIEVSMEEWDRDLWANLEAMANERPSLPGARGRFANGDDRYEANPGATQSLENGFDLEVDCWAVRLA